MLRFSSIRSLIRRTREGITVCKDIRELFFSCLNSFQYCTWHSLLSCKATDYLCYTHSDLLFDSSVAKDHYFYITVLLFWFTTRY